VTITFNTDYAAIEGAIRAWLEVYAAVGANKVIYARQDAPKPVRPYATIWIERTSEEQGLVEHRDLFDPGTEEIPSQIVRTYAKLVTALLRVDVYTGTLEKDGETLDALSRLRRAVMALELDSVRDTWNGLGFSWLTHEAVQQLDEFEGDRWERRAQVDIRLLFRDSMTDDAVEPVETVESITETPASGDPTLIIGE
jgi:hypothetical protein